MSIATAVSTINVPFHGTSLYIVNHNGEPYTPMRPIVEGMGLDWKSQHKKLTQRFSKGVVEMTIPSKGGKQTMLCLPLRKLAGWLQTISPNKVKPEIRDKVIQYQNECDDVLYEYWTTGEVKRKPKTTTNERTPLRDAINMLVGKKGLLYPEAYSLVHQHFNVSHIDELNAEQLPTAVEYIHRLVIDGELLERELQSEDFADLRKVLRSALRIQELLYLLTELWPKFATPLHLPPMFAGNVTESYHLSGIIVDSLKAKLKPHQRPRLF